MSVIRDFNSPSNSLLEALHSFMTTSNFPAHSVACLLKQSLNLDVIKYLYEINGLTQITDSDNLDQHSLWFICNHSYIDLNKRLQIAKFLIRKNVITGTSGNIKNDMIVNDIHKYIFDPKFKEEIKLWAENEIKKNKNLFLLFNILNKYDSKLKDLFRTIIDFDDYIYSHEIKNIKRFNLNII